MRSRRRRVIAFTVEGLGRAVGAVDLEGEPVVVADRLTRWATQGIADDPDGVYRAVMASDGLPGEISGQARFREGRSAISGVRVRLRATAEVLRAFVPTRTPVRLGRVPATGALSTSIPADLEQENAHIVLLEQDDPAFNAVGQVVMLGREAMALSDGGGLTGEGYNAYTGVLRGALGTRVQQHDALAQDDREVFLCSDPSQSDGRAVELVHPVLRSCVLLLADPDGGYEDEEVLRRYVLREITQPVPEVVELTMDSALELVRARRLCSRLWRGRRQRTPREEEVQPEVLYLGDGAPASGSGQSGRVGLFSVGGGTVVRATWGYQGSGAVIGLEAGEQPAVGGAPEYDPFEHDSDEAWECFSTSPSAPVLNNSADPRNNRLATNVIDLVQQILTTTAAPVPGEPGLNGPYDLGIGQLGCGVPHDLIDQASFDEARLVATGGAQQTALHLGVDGEPVDALPWLQARLLPYGYLLVSGFGGALALKKISSSKSGEEPLFTLTDFRDKPARASRLFDPLDRAVVRYDDRPGLGPRTESFEDANRQSRQVASAQESDLDLRGVRDRDIAASLTLSQIQRWRVELAQWTLPLRATDAALRLREGDKILVSHPHLTGPGGVRGVKEALCVVIEASFNFSLRGDPGPQVMCLWVGQRLQRQGQIGPAGVVSSVNGVEVTLEESVFSTPPAPGQIDDSFLFAPGQELEATSEDRETARGVAQVHSVDGLVITLQEAIAGLQVGDRLALAQYDLQEAEVTNEFAFWAGPNEADGVGANDAPPYQWVD